MSAVLRLGPEVSGSERMVLFVLAEAANTDTDECWPSTATIARRAGLRQDRYVVKAVASLAERGLVEVDPNGCPDQRIRADRRPNLYRMLGPMAVAHGGARRAGSSDDTGGRDAHDGGARRAATGGRDALPDPHVEPEQEPEGQPTRVEGALAAGFDAFWTVYPRKTAKGTARTVWPRAVKTAGGMEAIIAGARRYADDPNRDPAYTAHASTWLNGERWNDEPLPPRRPGRPAGPAPISEDRSGRSGRIQVFSDGSTE